MKRLLHICAILTLLVVASHDSQAQQEKLAQTGLKFLNVSSDPRAVAMGDAMTAVEGVSPAQFGNPAGMARITSAVNVWVGNTKWIADINHYQGSVAYSPSNGMYGVFGFSLQSVDYGDIQETIFDQSTPNGYQDIGIFKPSGLMLGLSYARALSDRFAIGGNVKYVTQNLGDAVVDVDTSGNRLTISNKLNVVAFDFGVLYRTGFKSLEFGMTVRNFSKEVKYQQEQFQLPLIFKIGISMNVLDLAEIDPKSQSFLVAVEATHPRDFKEQVNIGAEYMFAQILALRAGYMFANDLYGFSAGGGVRYSLEGVEIGVDYSYTPFKEFSAVHRIAVQMAL
jgi:hypothetical protein